MPISGKPLPNKACAVFLVFLLGISFALPKTVCSKSVDAESREVVQVLAAVTHLKTPAERIAAISGYFLGRPYAANTLVGGVNEDERLVVNLHEFDCFTFLDTVEALRRTDDPDRFIEMLRYVRYRGGDIAFVARRHFFSDWVADQSLGIVDVTQQVAGVLSVKVKKLLNRRSEEYLWLPGLPVQDREVTYIPSANIDEGTLERLQTGDYVGFYTGQAGLDVSHTGLVVKYDGKVMLRHASSGEGKSRVLDEPLSDYLLNREGLIVYRVSDKSLIND